MTLIQAVKKISNRKKRNGYYEASEILTIKEKQSLLIFSISLFVPVFVTSILLLVN